MMLFRSKILLAAAALLAPLLSSCSITQPAGSALAAYHAYDRPAKLPSDPSAVKVKVSLTRQRAYVMEGSTVLLVMPVSVGAPATPTPTGNFTILHKEAKHRAKSHGYVFKGEQVKRMSLARKPPGWSFKGTPMPYWCEFKPNYGFHTGWIKHSPCTNDGCIRMHENLAPKFFRLVQVGTPVNIARSQPEDITLGNIPLPPDSGPLPDYDSSMYTGDGYFYQHKAPGFD